MEDFEKELKEGFLQEAEGLLADAESCFLKLETIAANPAQADNGVLEKIFRLAHSLKGSAGAVGFEDIAHFTHELESLLIRIKKGSLRVETDIVNLLLESNDHLRKMISALKLNLAARVDSTDLLNRIRSLLEAEGGIPAPEQMPEMPMDFPVMTVAPAAPEADPSAHESAATSPVAGTMDEAIRVSLKRLDILMNNIGELVILQTVLTQQKSQIPSPLLQKTIVQLSKITKDIQGISMSLRMLPLKPTFQKLNRTLRDTSKILGKDIELDTSGDETEMDKTVIDHLGDPLVHIVRNAADHGIESPEDRIKAGKPLKGHVRIKAFHQGDKVILEISDDGRGLNPAVLKKKAIEKGILKPGREITDKAAYDLIFHPGFSTKNESEVTDISGRGVGMDVVKTNIERLQGDIQINTVIGQGTTFRILLPLTLAIIDAMVVSLGNERYVIPVTHIHESLQPQKKDLHHFTNVGDVLSLRGEKLPLVSLAQVLNRRTQQRAPHESIAIVVRTSERPFAVLVDDILGQQQIVIKRLGNELQNIRGFSGSCILGDGRAALILDLNELITRGSSAPRQATLGAA